MAGILTNITALVTAAIGWVGQYVGAITKAATSSTGGNELLLLFVIVAFVGTGIGLINRIIKL